MTKPFGTLASRLAIFILTALALVACGGGGGGGDGGFIGDNGSNTDTYFLALSLLGPDGNPTNLISTASPGTLVVTVTKNKATGNPIAGTTVSVSGNLDMLVNGSEETVTRLSDSAGMASFVVEAGQTKGAGTLSVSVTDENGDDVTATISFQVGATGLQLGYLADGVFVVGTIGVLPEGTISSEGQAVLSLAIVDDNGDLVTSAEKVRIESACLSAGTASIEPVSPIESFTGQISFTYTPADGCSDSDTVTATLIGVGAKAIVDLEIAPPTANSLTYISAEPDYIVLKGTGGGPDRVEQSTVTFTATDADGNPLSGAEVLFSLTTEVGGLSLSPTSAISDADGLVSTVVSSGDVATVVRVLATAPPVNGSAEVSAVSDELTVSTGLPDQNSISLSISDTFVVATGMREDGVTRSVNVRMADKFNNPVPDGTAALFTTEYGAIEPSCTTVDGACSVQWVSQQPRLPTLLENQPLVVRTHDPGYSCPSHNGSSGPCPDDLGSIRGGRSTVLVTALGEESFIDRNGNGVFDQAEADEDLFDNKTEPFLDHNENGLFDPATEACLANPDTLTCRAGSEEIFSDFNSNSRFDANGDDPFNGYPDEGQVAQYNGLLCPREGDGVWCSRELIRVFADQIIILADDATWEIAVYESGSRRFSTESGRSYIAYIADQFNNPPPGGSEVSISADGDCDVTVLSTREAPNTASPGAFGISFAVSGEGDEAGEVSISIDVTEGSTVTLGLPCTPTPPPDPNDPFVNG
ncbi:hypothetical protein E4634_19435 [Mangrovimicrobium sediminis]|uniref:Uncharacterized protein n=1 Tax=Mangrovimicrobium sediminis TaxID=2562682 RepID=A0A4Z0LVC1_9GAMM|nr:Ig-like domain-containing protein [Haliea sp. SAOS-164]TGD71184.1 hypothetical protein E4634_19435 [Haliea sp. SAOS-164]